MTIKARSYCIERKKFNMGKVTAYCNEHGNRHRRESGFERIFIRDNQTKEELMSDIKQFKYPSPIFHKEDY